MENEDKFHRQFELQRGHLEPQAYYFLFQKTQKKYIMTYPEMHGTMRNYKRRKMVIFVQRMTVRTSS